MGKTRHKLDLALAKTMIVSASAASRSDINLSAAASLMRSCFANISVRVATICCVVGLLDIPKVSSGPRDLSIIIFNYFTSARNHTKQIYVTPTPSLLIRPRLHHKIPVFRIARLNRQVDDASPSQPGGEPATHTRGSGETMP